MLRLIRRKWRWWVPIVGGFLFLQWMEGPPPPADEEDILWLARCLYSESHVPREQYLIGWVVRNRVASGYRGKTTYREVILDPIQFSAFNRRANRERFARLDRSTRSASWQSALRVAEEVISKGNWDNPLPATARHFYSAIGMCGRTPAWAKGKEPLKDLSVDDERLRIFADVD